MRRDSTRSESLPPSSPCWRKVGSRMKSGRKPNLVLENRIRLNAGRFSSYELAWLLGMTFEAVESKAARMKVSLRVKKPVVSESPVVQVEEEVA